MRLNVFKYISGASELARRFASVISQIKLNAMLHACNHTHFFVRLLLLNVTDWILYVSNFVLMADVGEYQHTSNRLPVVTSQPLF